ncbi:hypothetical protein DFQ27_005656 [Actinomortierella ambigua]|uniref:Uncharacterized protein n=1 Tax=Actinomortierella ambigua TaxID=1343610 RepID=A0A9P6U2N3_9FUNG|nr:hypothetical protein DFQ27_005656 [Actinomortierella ambigua]
MVNVLQRALQKIGDAFKRSRTSRRLAKTAGETHSERTAPGCPSAPSVGAICAPMLIEVLRDEEMPRTSAPVTTVPKLALSLGQPIAKVGPRPKNGVALPAQAAPTTSATTNRAESTPALPLEDPNDLAQEWKPTPSLTPRSCVGRKPTPYYGIKKRPALRVEIPDKQEKEAASTATATTTRTWLELEPLTLRRQASPVRLENQGPSAYSRPPSVTAVKNDGDNKDRDKHEMHKRQSVASTAPTTTTTAAKVVHKARVVELARASPKIVQVQRACRMYESMVLTRFLLTHPPTLGQPGLFQLPSSGATTATMKTKKRVMTIVLVPQPRRHEEGRKAAAKQGGVDPLSAPMPSFNRSSPMAPRSARPGISRRWSWHYPARRRHSSYNTVLPIFLPPLWMTAAAAARLRRSKPKAVKSP